MNDQGFLTPLPDNILVFRGPTWMNTNWYLSRGLRRHGRVDLAERIEDRSAALVERGGFLPCVDHRVPPDVTYENYLYYLEKKKAIL